MATKCGREEMCDACVKAGGCDENDGPCSHKVCKWCGNTEGEFVSAYISDKGDTIDICMKCLIYGSEVED